MSHSLAKKLDKIVAKLGSGKNKENKSNGNESHEAQANTDDSTPSEGNTESSHESILQRMKGHLGHMHGSSKAESHHPVEGAPPVHVVANDLRDSPFKGKFRLFSPSRPPSLARACVRNASTVEDVIYFYGRVSRPCKISPCRYSLSLSVSF